MLEPFLVCWQSNVIIWCLITIDSIIWHHLPRHQEKLASSIFRISSNCIAILRRWASTFLSRTGVSSEGCWIIQTTRLKRSSISTRVSVKLVSLLLVPSSVMVSGKSRTSPISWGPSASRRASSFWAKFNQWLAENSSRLACSSCFYIILVFYHCTFILCGLVINLLCLIWQDIKTNKYLSHFHFRTIIFKAACLRQGHDDPINFVYVQQLT